MPNGRCMMHGGKSLAGIASPTFKNGKYSKYLPKGIGEMAWDAANDPDLLNLTELIGVYHARLNMLFGLVESGASAERFRAIKETFTNLDEAVERKDRGAIVRYMAEMRGLVQDIDHDWMLWK